MANRHKKQGGEKIKDVYSGADSKVEKEAKERKHGGKVMGKAMGGKSKMRLDKRARGGRIGGGGGDCMKSPFTAAHVKTNGDA